MMPPGTLRAAIGKTTASYPIPFLATSILGSAVVIVALSIALPAQRWALFALAGVLFGFAMFIVAYALIRKPHLLRSERTFLVSQALDLLGDDEIGELAGDRIERTLSMYLDRSPARMGGQMSRKRSLSDDRGDEEKKDG